ncbi:hypothetical protein CTA1_11268 [Colletotrichum tanaceti]|uniref:Uncharacterized protein n=1 Tax=Colletotrichum tanaceti TaxID=1306861 RepID=A0A4U6X5C0_9PEZI|nr:hypothetical protein CTA1_11268 [Colletotrichum tanaceti]
MTTRGKLNAVDFGTWEDAVKDRIEKVIPQDGARHLDASETPDALLGPSDFALELVKLQGRGAQQGRRGAPRDIVAGEGEEIDENWKSEGDEKGADAVQTR